MRQDVSMTKHIIDISQHLIGVAVEQKNWVAVSSNVQKIRGVMTSEDELFLQPYLYTTEGLAFMDSGEYYNAALRFLQTQPGLGGTSAPGAIPGGGSVCNTIISPNDVAVYGGLCALATMERNELHSQVLENSKFRTYL